jgi:hypothetical protein
MTPEYRKEIEIRIKEYFKSFEDIDATINIIFKETFTDLEKEVNVLNVRAKSDIFFVDECKIIKTKMVNLIFILRYADPN